jgi:hypothetical protein
LTGSGVALILRPVRIPSIRAAAAGAWRVSTRFPFVLGTALAAAAVGCGIAGQDRVAKPLEATLVAATLGLPLFTALALAAERTGSRRLAIALGCLGVALLAGVGSAWPQWTEAVRFRRYAQFSLGFHLLVAFLPWWDGREPNGFWQYNRVLFIRFLSAGLHSAVLFAGLAVALLALDKLFGLKVHGTAYLRLWVLVAFVFNTWFFLGGVPGNLAALEQRRDYPLALKVFTQFILIPLVVVYLAILTAYLIRVLFTGQWPSNWIGYLVSSVATAGILSILLVHPLRDEPEHRWVGRYARWFYLALLPAVGMLLFAIGKRVGQYGVTEDRYFILVLAVWLAAISVLFLVRHRTGVRWIPITLCALAFATLAGPLGAYGVSRRSQTARLRVLLERSGLLVRGAIVPAGAAAPFEVRRQLSAVIAYLLDAHGPAPVRSVLGGAMPALTGQAEVRGTTYAGQGADARKVMTALGLTYVDRWEGSQSESFYYSGFSSRIRAVPVGDADFHVRLDGTMPAEIAVAGESWRFECVRGALALVTPRDTLWFPLDALIDYAHAHGAGPDSVGAPRLTQRASGITALLVPRTYSGAGHGDSVSVYQMAGDLYLTVR